MRDLEDAMNRVDYTEDPAALLALAGEIRSRFGGELQANAVALRALTKWMRLRYVNGQAPVAASLNAAVSVALLRQIQDAASLAELEEITAATRRLLGPAADQSAESAASAASAAMWLRLTHAALARAIVLERHSMARTSEESAATAP